MLLSLRDWSLFFEELIVAFRGIVTRFSLAIDSHTFCYEISLLSIMVQQMVSIDFG